MVTLVQLRAIDAVPATAALVAALTQASLGS
jgi:hypothetical protein